MKKILGTLAGLVLLTGGIASAQSNSANVDASASATVISPIAVTNPVGLNFGQIVAGSGAGTVVLTAAGVRSIGTGTTQLGNSGSVAAAGFSVTGNANSTYSISVEAGPVDITSVAADTMTVGSFTRSKTTGTLTSGADTFTVGGTLGVAAAQPVGAYSGTFNVVVTYN